MRQEEERAEMRHLDDKKRVVLRRSAAFAAASASALRFVSRAF
jgi:hypothetical protein